MRADPSGQRARSPVIAETWPETSSVCICVHPWNIFLEHWVLTFESSGIFEFSRLWS